MRLIDTDKLKFPNIAIFDMKLHGVTVPMVRLIDLQILMPTVDAVPLDKLCEWLARIGCPCEINDGMCDMSHGVDRCLGIFNSNSFCWKYLLTKWMEGLDGNAD